jgi:hypothetical protein
MKTAAGYTITLPEITASDIGCEFVIKRIGGSLQILSVAIGTSTASTFRQPIFFMGSTLGNITASQTLISATQNISSLTSMITQYSGSGGNFTNAAGSAVITINNAGTCPSFTIGGWLTLNGNSRQIISYGTGLGGTGTYTVNAVIAGANTAATFTANETYGWGVTSTF